MGVVGGEGGGEEEEWMNACLFEREDKTRLPSLNPPHPHYHMVHTERDARPLPAPPAFLPRARRRRLWGT